MIRVSSVRFFLVVCPAPVWIRAAFAVAVLAGAATLWLDPAEVDSALGPILLLQMFSASNAYAASAARGYLDPMLITGRPGWRMAAAHLLAAALPGVIAWAVILAVATALGQPRAAAAPQRQVALLIVSSVAWSGGLALPRMASGALWSITLITLALSRGALADALPALQSTPIGLREVVASAGMSVLCPFLLLGNLAAAGDTRVLALGVVAALGATLAGWGYVCRREHPLVEPV